MKTITAAQTEDIRILSETGESKEVSFYEFYAFIDSMERLEMTLEGDYPYTRIYSRLATREIVAKSTATTDGGVYPPKRRYFINMSH